jgi:hypothetical protein
MASAQQLDTGKAGGSDSHESLRALIRSQVVRMLGTPEHMRKVLVHPVGQDSFRVNVIVGKDAATSRIADSFFLTVDGDGNILTSAPKIARLY